MSEASEIAREILEMGDTSHSSWVRGSCPFCITRIGKEDLRRSFAVNAETGFFHCFRCGIKGRMDGDFDDMWQKPWRHVTQAPQIKLPDEHIPLYTGPGIDAEATLQARDYLLSRGFSDKTLLRARIGVCLEGYFRHRIIVPITEANSVRGFVARDYTGHADMKYVYPKGMNRANMLFGENSFSAMESDDALLVVEGVFDALPYVGNAVACLGKPTVMQVELLKTANRPLAIVLDGDAWEEGYSLSQKLRLNGKRAGYVKLPAGEDPGSVDPCWLLEEAQKCVQ
jgi:hypothetical protein